MNRQFTEHVRNYKCRSSLTHFLHIVHLGPDLLEPLHKSNEVKAWIKF